MEYANQEAGELVLTLRALGIQGERAAEALGYYLRSAHLSGLVVPFKTAGKRLCALCQSGTALLN